MFSQSRENHFCKTLRPRGWAPSSRVARCSRGQAGASPLRCTTAAEAAAAAAEGCNVVVDRLMSRNVLGFSAATSAAVRTTVAVRSLIALGDTTHGGFSTAPPAPQHTAVVAHAHRRPNAKTCYYCKPSPWRKLSSET